MPDTLHDGNYRSPVTIGARRFEYPFRINGDRVSALFEEDYWQEKSYWTPLEYSTPHPTLDGFYLMLESDPIEHIAGLVKFTRTYSRVPAQQTEGSSILVPMPEPGSAAGVEGLFTEPGWGPITFFANGATPFYAAPNLWTNVGTGIGITTPNFFYGQNTYFGNYKPGSVINWAGNTAGGVRAPSFFNVPNHNFTNGKDVVVLWGNTNATNTRSSIRAFMFYGDQWTYVNANCINGPNGPQNFAVVPNVTMAQASRGSFGTGSRYLRCTRITNFYLPGITPGITTLADIPLPSDQSGSVDFLNALFTGAGSINVQVGELTRWRNSPIYMITKTVVDVVDIL